MGTGAMKLWLGCCAVVAALSLTCAPSAAAAGQSDNAVRGAAIARAVDPSGAHDARGFRNILPAGENGTDNAAELGAFEASGDYPPHWTDQQPLYDGLIQGSPRLTNKRIGNYYKDATFGVKPPDVESTETPKPGVTIIRDKQFGVPHVYGDTRPDAMFGEGYASAEDRLFLMDVLRHTGRAQLSSFVGGSPSNRAMDHAQWQFAPYTEQDLQDQIDNADNFYGAQGARLVADVNSFVDGINAYIA